MKHHSLASQDDARDPFEAIYALNIGDFVAESFISDELLDKISNRLADDPNKLRAQLDELIHIYSVDKTLGVLGFKSQEGFVIYDSLAATLCRMFQADACHLFQTARKETGEQYLSLTGTSVSVNNTQRWEIGLPVQADDLLSEAYRESGTLVVDNLRAQASWQPMPRLGQNKTESLIAAPLREGSKPLGLLVFETYEKTDFSPEQVRLAETAASLLVTSLRLQQLAAEAQEKIARSGLDSNLLLNMRAQITESIADLGIHQQEFVEALSEAVDARNQFTRGHSKQVASIARAIAEAMELNEKTVDLTYAAGLLGSLGKVDIPQAVMAKKDSLSPEEWDRLREHPNVGVSLLVKINFLSEVVPYVHSQNERWDGSGGPEGLNGRSIPLGSRILAVANAYYAMTQERPYRKEAPMDHEAALNTLQAEAGAKWDPSVVEALAKISSESLR